MPGGGSNILHVYGRNLLVIGGKKEEKRRNWVEADLQLGSSSAKGFEAGAGVDFQLWKYKGPSDLPASVQHAHMTHASSSLHDELCAD